MLACAWMDDVIAGVWYLGTSVASVRWQVGLQVFGPLGKASRMATSRSLRWRRPC